MTGRMDGASAMSSGRHVRLERAVFRFEPLLAPQRARQFHLRSHDRQQPRVLPRLLHEIAGAAAHGLDGHFDAAPRRHDDDRQRRIVMLHLRQQVEPFLARRGIARVIEVHQHSVELFASRSPRGSRRGSGPSRSGSPRF